MVYFYFYISSGTLTRTSHWNDELCVIVRLHSAMFWNEISSIYDRRPSQSCSDLEIHRFMCNWLWLIHQYFMGQPLLFSTCLLRFGIEWTSITKWSWVTTRFQAAMNDSISSHLLVGYLFDISKAVLCQKFLIWFRSGYWAGQSSVLMLFWDFHLVTSFARWRGAL